MPRRLKSSARCCVRPPASTSSGRRDMAPLRVVQWTTGIVGASALRAILDDDRLELVGVFAHGAEKVGQDAGALAGRPYTGVVATDDVDALLGLAPDCVVYM